MNRSIFIGFDPREAAAYAVCRHSLERNAAVYSIDSINGLVLEDLQDRGLYTRPMRWRKVPPSLGLVMWDVISEAPMSTQHANARFLVPHLAQAGWAMFCDGDMLFRADVGEIFDDLDDTKAIYCVKHKYEPKNKEKMDGQINQAYHRKNWSSFMIFNCDHPATKKLTVEMVNSVPGRDLHRFCWIEDDDWIGALDPAWNYLVGDSKIEGEPKCVHFTSGVPDMRGFETVEYADEWRDELRRWAL